MQDLEHENYILNSILKSSPSSENFSFEEYRKTSSAYYSDLKEQLLDKYQGKKLTDIKGSKVIDTPYGDTLQIVDRQKIDFSLAENNFKNQNRRKKNVYSFTLGARCRFLKTRRRAQKDTESRSSLRSS